MKYNTTRHNRGHDCIVLPGMWIDTVPGHGFVFELGVSSTGTALHHCPQAGGLRTGGCCTTQHAVPRQHIIAGRSVCAQLFMLANPGGNNNPNHPSTQQLRKIFTSQMAMVEGRIGTRRVRQLWATQSAGLR